MTTSLYLQLRKQNSRNFAPFSLSPWRRHNFQWSCPNFQLVKTAVFWALLGFGGGRAFIKFACYFKKLFLWQLHYICSSENKTRKISHHFHLVREGAKIFSEAAQIFSHSNTAVFWASPWFWWRKRFPLKIVEGSRTKWKWCEISRVLFSELQI